MRKSHGKGKKSIFEFMVRESQLDSFGHVNHAFYFQILEDARWDLMTSNGYGIAKIRETGLGPTILEIKSRYRQELLPRQKVRIETECVGYDRLVGRLEQKMFDEKGRVCCVAEFAIALMDVNARKLVPPTDDWKKAIGL